MNGNREREGVNVSLEQEPLLTIRGKAATLVSRILHSLPEGRSLPAALWHRRHRGILVLLWVQAIGLAVFALATGNTVDHSLVEGGAVAATALAASVAMIVNWRAHETSQAYTELILDSAGDGICGVDATGVITFMNPSGARTLGWDRGELVGRPIQDVLLPRAPDGTASPFDAS